MTKPILFQFHPSTDLPGSDGLKMVLFKLSKDDQFIGYDWGFANFRSGAFEVLEYEGKFCKVVGWAELPNPQLLLG